MGVFLHLSERIARDDWLFLMCVFFSNYENYLVILLRSRTYVIQQKQNYMYTNLLILVYFIAFYTLLFVCIDKVIHRMTWQEILYSRGVIVFFIFTYEFFSLIIIDEFKSGLLLHQQEATFFTKIVYAIWISLVAYTLKNILEVKKMTNLSLRVLLSSTVLIIGDWYFSP